MHVFTPLVNYRRHSMNLQTKILQRLKIDICLCTNYYVHLVIGLWQSSPPLILQYLQHLISATLHLHPFLRAHLPHVQGSGRVSDLEITISGTNSYILPSFKTVNLSIHALSKKLVLEPTCSCTC